MEFKGTKKQWGVNGNLVQVNIKDPANTTTICSVYGDTADPEKKANINLISAAPNLLEAAIYWLENFESDDPNKLIEETMFHGFKNAVNKALKSKQ